MRVHRRAFVMSLMLADERGGVFNKDDDDEFERTVDQVVCRTLWIE